MQISPTTSNIFRSLGTFVVGVLPGFAVAQGQPNRVAEVKGAKFVLMNPPRFSRLSTNVDGAADCRFVGSIAGTILTVTQAGGVPDSSTFGTIALGAALFGTGVAAGTTVQSQLTQTGDPGGIGTYQLSGDPQTVSSEVMSTGQKTLTQNAEVVVQLDFHADDTSSGDMAMTVSTALRDEYGTTQFAEQIPNYGVSPLYADDPTQVPFVNDQAQVEFRWVLDVHLQVDMTIIVPQQYSDSVEVQTISVDASYPP